MGAAMDGDRIIALLHEDLEGEHGAIIQYLAHAYAMGQREMACETEAIAREKMRQR
jgi:bacterioferritin